jgi:hypothetical protein
VKISLAEARRYWAHPSQQVYGAHPDTLPEWAEYWASGPVCGAFHMMPWPGVWMAHVGADPDLLGHLDEPARRVLRGFWHNKAPSRVVAWIDERNAGVRAFARRLGFEIDGRFPGVVMMGWQPCR